MRKWGRVGESGFGVADHSLLVAAQRVDGCLCSYIPNPNHLPRCCFMHKKGPELAESEVASQNKSPSPGLYLRLHFSAHRVSAAGGKDVQGRMQGEPGRSAQAVVSSDAVIFGDLARSRAGFSGWRTSRRRSCVHGNRG